MSAVVGAVVVVGIGVIFIVGVVAGVVAVFVADVNVA